MRYVMKQKLFCWGDDFTIKDDLGRDMFFVDGKAFSIGEQLSFQDMTGNELAFIRQKLLFVEGNLRNLSSITTRRHRKELALHLPLLQVHGGRARPRRFGGRRGLPLS